IMMKIKSVLLSLFLGVAAAVLAQGSPQRTPAPKTSAATKSAAPAVSPVTETTPTLLPGQAQVEAALKRTLGYDAALSWQVLDIRPSGIPDVSEILVSINKQEPNHIYWYGPTQSAIIGNMIPFGPDPFATARAKLQGAQGPARGAQSPAILIVDFSDLQCPHC